MDGPSLWVTWSGRGGDRNFHHCIRCSMPLSDIGENEDGPEAYEARPTVIS